MPLFSIIIPVYQAAKYLDRLVCSVLAQTYSDYELILVDDGSTDGSGALCDRYSATYENIMTLHQKNGGVSSARNAGIKASTGDYLVFFDADDFVEADYLRSAADVLKTHDPDLVVYGYYRDTPKKSVPIIPKCTGLFSVQACAGDICSSFFNPMWNKIFRADIVKSNHLAFQNRKLTEDGIFMCEYCMCAATVFLAPQAFYHYVQNGSSAVHTFCGSQWEDRLFYTAVFCEFVKSCAAPNANESVAKKYRDAIFSDLYYLSISNLPIGSCAQTLRSHINEVRHMVYWAAADLSTGQKVQLLLLKAGLFRLAVWLLRLKKRITAVYDPRRT